MLDRYFQIRAHGSSIRREIFAGFASFLAVSYLLAVIPRILSETGMPSDSVFTATAIAAAVSTLLMGILARLPFVLAPGIGSATFFTSVVCLGMGYSWQTALGAVFIEGVLFILLTACNVRELLIKILPPSLKKAIPMGVGLFIISIGFKFCIPDDPSGLFDGTFNTSTRTILLTGIGIVLSGILFLRRVPGALLIGIVLTSLIGIPLGISKYQGIFATPPSLGPTLFHLDFSELFSTRMLVVVFTFLFIDLFDTLGTLVGVSTKAKLLDPSGRVRNGKQALMSDAVGTTAGSLLGVSTVTTVIESVIGIFTGGRTGLTAVVTAFFLLLALFMSPFFLGIPVSAIYAAMIVVGAGMLSPIREIRLRDYTESIPTLICILVMPLTNSIADGIACGVISYVALGMVSGKFRKLPFGTYILALLFLFRYLLR